MGEPQLVGFRTDLPCQQTQQQQKAWISPTHELVHACPSGQVANYCSKEHFDFFVIPAYSKQSSRSDPEALTLKRKKPSADNGWFPVAAASLNMSKDQLHDAS